MFMDRIKGRRELRATTALAALLGVAAYATPVWAADQQVAAADTASSNQIEEVVVTAQKRAQTLQSVPVAVSVVGGDAVKDSQIQDLRDLPVLVPSLTVTQSASTSNTSFSIRGLGTSSFNAGLEPAVGVFIDGVYRSRQSEAISDLTDVERIEVLRGPQSTLFGRNTSAGVISIITKSPEFDFGATGEATFGNYSSRIFKGSVTGPIVDDKLAFRLAGSYNTRDGFIKNLANGKSFNNRNRWNMRGKLLFKPTNDLTVNVIADYSHYNERCCAAPFYYNDPVNAAAITALGGTVLPAKPYERKVQVNGALASKATNKGVSAQIDWDKGSFLVTSITAYRHSKDAYQYDTDFTDVDLAASNAYGSTISTFTQELRIASQGTNRVDWLAGAYYLNQKIVTGGPTTYGADLRSFADLVSGGAVSYLEFLQGAPTGSYLANGQGLQNEHYVLNTESYAGFGNVDFHVTDKLTLTGGLRYSSEDKDITANININDPFSALDLNTLYGGAFGGLSVLQFYPPTADFSRNRNETNVSGKAIISYQVSDNLNLYTSYSRGYKGGGFNVSTTAAASGFDFKPEIVDAYEAGAKATLLDGRANIYLAAFDQTVRDFQANVFNGTAFVLQNAGKIGLRGVEVEAQARPLNGLLVSFGATYLDAVIKSFPNGPCPVSAPGPTCNLGGHVLPDTSKWTVTSTATYTHELTDQFVGFIRGELAYRSSRSLMLNGDIHGLQGSSLLVNASAGISGADGSWRLSVWGKNITDEKFAQGIFDSVAQAGSYSGYPNDPPTYGVTLSVQTN